MNTRRKKLFYRVFAVWLPLLVGLLFILTPIYWLVTMSLKRPVDISAIPPKIFNFQVVFDAWEFILFSGPPYLRYLLNSFIIASSVTLLAVFAGGLAAYSLSRLRFRGRYLFMFWILTARILPPVVIGIPFYLLMRQLGIIDTYVAVVLAHSSFVMPMAIWVMTAFFEQLPRAIEDSAKIDGATPFQAFIRVVVPVSLSGVTAAGMLSFIFSWNEFFYSLIIAGTSTRPMTVAVAGFQGSISLRWDDMAAAATLTILPLVILFVVAQRHMVSGLTSGAID